MSSKILRINEFKFREDVGDPYLARMHHVDYYPKGNGQQGVPAELLKDKSVGEDFDLTSDWKMYYGKEVPGFPVHPHRSFETVTIVLQGFVDHSDSSGLTGRYGAGDVQWMTAGSGMQHAEMFPLVHDDRENTLELFQVWLNLPARDKFVTPYYKMLWAEQIPTVVEETANGSKATINVIAGTYKGTQSLDPNPDSWAFDRDHHVGILTVRLEPGAQFSLPAVSATLNRNLYHYRGDTIMIDGAKIDGNSSLKLAGDAAITVTNGPAESFLILLEGEPINEPVVNYGPFVMNTMEEIEQAYRDYETTRFGGWPWNRKDPVNPKDSSRFARYGPDEVEKP
ncbi:MAG: pirin family protein [Bacillota bacterium]|nr:pirin family protein [Bacillota bacterium]